MANTNDIRVSQRDTTNLGFTMIEVRVGSDRRQRKFSLHKELAASRSEFFTKAMNGDWKEAEDNVIELPDDDPEIFALYVQLLYTGKLPIKNDVAGPLPEEDGDISDAEMKRRREARRQSLLKEFQSLCLMYVLCEKLIDIVAKNSIVDTIVV